MNSEEIYEIFGYRMTTEKISEITIEQLEETYEFLYQNYMDYFHKLENKPENMNDFFFWTSKKLDINLVYYKNENRVRSMVFFSKSERKGTILLYNLTQQDFGYEILRLDDRSFLSTLIQRKILNIEPEEIIDYRYGGVIDNLVKDFFDWEYDHHWKPQLKTSFENVSFNTLRIHKDLYDFVEMIKTINNDQFTLELEECLGAYENEKFFICAAGLGSVLEHLLYLAINKQVSRNDIKINENSMASDYIKQLKEQPFMINKREVSHLKSIFNYRNSVSHFNKGIFSKEMCDQLLGGIKVSFDNYYMFEIRSTLSFTDASMIEIK